MANTERRTYNHFTENELKAALDTAKKIVESDEDAGPRIWGKKVVQLYKDILLNTYQVTNNDRRREVIAAKVGLFVKQITKAKEEKKAVKRKQKRERKKKRKQRKKEARAAAALKDIANLDFSRFPLIRLPLPSDASPPNNSNNNMAVSSNTAMEPIHATGLIQTNLMNDIPFNSFNVSPTPTPFIFGNNQPMSVDPMNISHHNDFGHIHIDDIYSPSWGSEPIYKIPQITTKTKLFTVMIICVSIMILCSCFLVCVVVRVSNVVDADKVLNVSFDDNDLSNQLFCSDSNNCSAIQGWVVYDPFGGTACDCSSLLLKNVSEDNSVFRIDNEALYDISGTTLGELIPASLSVDGALNFIPYPRGQLSFTEIGKTPFRNCDSRHSEFVSGSFQDDGFNDGFGPLATYLFEDCGRIILKLYIPRKLQQSETSQLNGLHNQMCAMFYTDVFHAVYNNDIENDAMLAMKSEICNKVFVGHNASKNVTVGRFVDWCSAVFMRHQQPVEADDDLTRIFENDECNSYVGEADALFMNDIYN